MKESSTIYSGKRARNYFSFCLFCFFDLFFASEIVQYCMFQVKLFDFLKIFVWHGN